MFVKFLQTYMPTGGFFPYTIYAVFYVSYISMIIYKQYNIRGKHQDKFWEVRVDIEEAYSRKTTEGILEIVDFPHTSGGGKITTNEGRRPVRDPEGVSTLVELFGPNLTPKVASLPEEFNDDDTGHWYFWSGKYTDPQFQAVNCLVCGEYIFSDTTNAPKCNCKNDIKISHKIDDSSEYSSIDSLDIKTYNWIPVASEDYIHKYAF